MPRHDKVKIKGANGQTGGKNSSSTFKAEYQWLLQLN
jgi:hypothetical protein